MQPKKFVNVKMKKICTKCNKEWTDLNEADMFCPECCGTLKSVVDGVVDTPRGMQVDNSIHKGDNIDVAGNNLNAQNIDNRTVTNTTTINNYQNIVDETKKVFKCELSGKMVSIMDIVECPKCHRMVANQFYVDQSFMCIECYEKFKPKPDLQQTTSQSHQIDKQSAIPMPQQKVEQGVPMVAAPRKSHSKVVLGVLALVVVAVAIFAFKGGNADKNENTTPAKQEHITIAEQKSSGSDVAVKSKDGDKGIIASNSVAKFQHSAATKKEAALKAPVKESASVSATAKQMGVDAYKSGNYVKAELLLKAEADNGNAASAYCLAIMYKDGKGVSKDAKSAFVNMKRAADAGYSDAYYELAEMYRLGLGTEANRANAKIWYVATVTNDGKNAAEAAKRLKTMR